MPILSEIDLGGAIPWRSDLSHQWSNDQSHAWDSGGGYALVSDVGFAGEHYWDPYIISFTPPRYELPSLCGGFCTMKFGSIAFCQDLFAGSARWPPPPSFPLYIYYTATTEAAMTLLFDGTAHLASLTREAVEYVLYAKQLDAELLDEEYVYSEEGEESGYTDDHKAPIPRAFGTVSHAAVPRAPDRATSPTYYWCGIDTDVHVFDDGVDIDSNVTDNGDGTFSLSAMPVGQVTVSGTASDVTTLADLVQWAAAVDRLNTIVEDVYARTPSPVINYFAESQQLLVEFLSSAALVNTHIIYMIRDTLYLVDADADHGQRYLTEHDYFPSSYEMPQPVSLLRAAYPIREAVEDRTGPHVKETRQEVVHACTYSYGEEVEVECYDTDPTRIRDRLTRMQQHLDSPIIHLAMPITADLIGVGWTLETSHVWAADDDHEWGEVEAEKPPPLPGEKIYLTDTSMKQPIYVGMRCHGLQYDLSNDVVVVDAHGSLALTQEEIQ